MTIKQIDTILKKMFEMVGADITKVDMKSDKWYLEHTWTEEQEEEFITWTANFLYKKGKITKKRARHQAEALNFYCGWKVV